MMNYSGHELLHADLSELVNSMDSLRMQIRELEKKYHDGCPGLVDALAADFLRGLNEQFLSVYIRALAFCDCFRD
ncbi:hypothetical protein [Pantoea sp. BAV 3049]|uniref:hypothetical protein n=1 Tax=Pantoea sp. BAV 3049 TaxID=2654188 RepID=UPI00131E9C18|nr:hypothetical protein [Pantoea sp. BAV 3049]